MNIQSDQQPRNPKVRQSCDTCQASKIRCGQERPMCRRCVKHNIACIYSISRRAGRPRHRRTISSTTPPEPISEEASQPQSTPLTSISPAQPSVPSGTCSRPSPLSITSPHPSMPTTATQSLNNERNIIDQYNNHPQSELQQQIQHHEVFPSATVDSDAVPFPTLSLPHSTTGLLNGDSPVFMFDAAFSPLQNCVETSGPQMHYFDPSSGYSAPSSASLGATNSSKSRDSSLDWISVPGVCLCSAMLLQQLAESPAPACRTYEDGEISDSAAVQKSKALLNHCFQVLSCERCGPELSSVLMLCQAMDEVSKALGMGTLWAEGSSDRLQLSRSWTRVKVPLRCGTYSVRASDQRVILQALLRKRGSEMRRAMTMLHQIMLPAGAASSSCQDLCTSIVSEFKEKVTLRAGSLKVQK